MTNTDSIQCYDKERYNILQFIAEEIEKQLNMSTCIWSFYPAITIYEHKYKHNEQLPNAVPKLYISLDTNHYITLSEQHPLARIVTQCIGLTGNQPSHKNTPESISYRSTINNPRIIQDIIINIQKVIHKWKLTKSQ